MAYFNHRQPPPLKNGVDIQLQTAFSEQNWATVVRLADKRAKTIKDPYYEAVKVCAETKLDGITEKSAAAVAVDAWVRSGTVPKDIESVELFEWACQEARLRLDYAETFGVLRFRWVKANPRNVKVGTACLRECLLNWDLVNAQQIATVLDKSSNANDRRFMFWSILLTHLLSSSQQCAEAKRKIYGMLAQKQLEKAAEPAEANGLSTGAAVPPTDRSLRDQEEFLLYFRVLAAHGTPENYAQRALNANAGAAKQFAAGHKQLFLEVLSQLEAGRQWDAVFDLCRQALSTTDDSGRPSTLACDLRIWNSFIAASQKHVNVEEAFEEVQDVLNRFITADPKLPQMYIKNVGLALLQMTFSLPSSLVPQPAEGESSLQVEQLLAFVEANLDKASVFGDIKKFVEKLSFAEAKDFLEKLAAYAPQDDSSNHQLGVLRTVLGFKLRYLLTTCPETTCPRSFLADSNDAAPNEKFELACKFCKNAVKPSGCTSCLHDIATGSLRLHHKLSGDAEFVQAVPRLDKDPRIDLALVAVSSLLRLSGMRRSGSKPGRPWLAGLDLVRLLQAALVLDAQQRQTPNDIPVRLLLIRVSAVLGCASHAMQLWSPLGVKRSILDALGPLFYDRLSTLSPGLFAGAKPLLEPLRQYYSTVFRYPSAVNIWDAFASGSYSSILDMAQFNESLQHSCTRVMTVVEERRTARTFGAKMESVEDLSIFDEITNDVGLVNATDYGSIPNLESSNGASLAEITSLGPGLSNIRMHLGLLAERYLDLINFKPVKEYKPAKPSEAAAREKVFLLESFSVLQSSFDDFLHQPSARAHLTAGEFAYYTVVSALASFLAFSLASNGPGESSPQSVFPLLAQTLTTSVDILRKSVVTKPTAPPDNFSDGAWLLALTNLHSMAMLRDTAVAIKQTAAFATAFHDKENARDRTGKSGLGKEALAEARAFKTLAVQVLADVKAHIKFMKDALDAHPRLAMIDAAVTIYDGGSALPEAEQLRSRELSRAVVEAVGGSAAVRDWAGHLLESWKDNIKGWGQVQLE